MKKIFKSFIYIFSMLAFVLSGAPTLGIYAENGGDEHEKQLIVYYSNWSTGRQQVKDLPWDRLSIINHAFWRISPNAEMTEFPIASLNTHADFGAGMCFDQYEEITAKYPNVKVLISVGGWNDTKWFARMAISLGIGIFADGYEGEAQLVIAGNDNEDIQDMPAKPVMDEENDIDSDIDTNGMNPSVWIIAGISVLGIVFVIYYLYRS